MTGGNLFVADDLECDHSVYGAQFQGGQSVQITSSFLGSSGQPFSGTYCGSGPGNGITFAASFVGDAELSNNRIYGNCGNGVVVTAGSDVTLTGNTIGDNSQYAANTYHGVVFGPNISNFSVNSNRIGAVAPGLSAAQAYCVFVSSGSSDYYNITNNNCQGNTSGTVLNGAGGAHTTITGNIGP
jgi:parallel beta-helix repeat protein